MVDGVILVASAKQTVRREVVAAAEQLRADRGAGDRHGAELVRPRLGVVVRLPLLVRPLRDRQVLRGQCSCRRSTSRWWSPTSTPSWWCWCPPAARPTCWSRCGRCCSTRAAAATTLDDLVAELAEATKRRPGVDEGMGRAGPRRVRSARRSRHPECHQRLTGHRFALNPSRFLADRPVDGQARGTKRLASAARSPCPRPCCSTRSTSPTPRPAIPSSDPPTPAEAVPILPPTAKTNSVEIEFSDGRVRPPRASCGSTGRCSAQRRRSRSGRSDRLEHRHGDEGDRQRQHELVHHRGRGVGARSAATGMVEIARYLGRSPTAASSR